MKLRIAYLVVIATTLFAQVGQAETSMVVTVPFPFTANDTQMPAGKYAVSRVTARAVKLQLDGVGKSLIVVTDSKETLSPQSRGRLLFNHVGDRYFLSEIWERNTDTGRVLRKPSIDPRYVTDSTVPERAIGD